MRRVVITGAGGFIGKALAEKMIENEVEVVAVSANYGPGFPKSHLITPIECIITSSEELSELIPASDYDAFFHLAWNGVNGPAKADALLQLANVDLALQCADAARTIGCRRFLCSGTIAERALESLPLLREVGGGLKYAAAKESARLMLETHCKSIDLDFIWMQFSNVYGPQNKTGNIVSYTLERLLSGSEATFGPAEQPYDLIYIDDLIEAVYRLGEVEDHEDRYFIGSGQPRILMEYLLEIGEICDGLDLIRIGARRDDGIRYDFDMFAVERLVADVGRYITTSFREGINRTIQEMKRC